VSTEPTFAMQRWRLALHEAAHGIVGRLLADDGLGVGAAISTAGPGRCWCPMPDNPLLAALVFAAGPAGEALAASHAPPDEPPDARQSEAADGLLAEVLTAEKSGAELKAPDDTATVAAFAGRFSAERVQWNGLYLTMLNAARALVEDHSAEIVALARRLFREGLCVHRSATGVEENAQ